VIVLAGNRAGRGSDGGGDSIDTGASRSASSVIELLGGVFPHQRGASIARPECSLRLWVPLIFRERFGWGTQALRGGG
jgi:hypothetical protein